MTDRPHLLEMNKCMTSVRQSTLPDLPVGGALQLEIIQHLLVLRELTEL